MLHFFFTLWCPFVHIGCFFTYRKFIWKFILHCKNKQRTSSCGRIIYKSWVTHVHLNNLWSSVMYAQLNRIHHHFPDTALIDLNKEPYFVWWFIAVVPYITFYRSDTGMSNWALMWAAAYKNRNIRWFYKHKQSQKTTLATGQVQHNRISKAI